MQLLSLRKEDVRQGGPRFSGQGRLWTKVQSDVEMGFLFVSLKVWGWELIDSFKSGSSRELNPMVSMVAIGIMSVCNVGRGVFT